MPIITDVYNLNNSIFKLVDDRKQLNKIIKKILFSIFILLIILSIIKIVLKIRITEIKKYCGVTIKLKKDSVEKKIIKL